MADRFLEQIWNQFDEMALLAGLDRIPGETNEQLRRRILNHKKYDSTDQGLLNYISEALLTTSYNVIRKKEFFSQRQPLSFSQYQAISEPSADYYSPRVTVGGTTWILAPTSSEQTDSVTSDGITWSLWKQPDGSYDRIWTTDIVPTGDVSLKYQWQDDGGLLHHVHESSKILTWVDGTIVEEYPPEAT